MVDHPVGRRSEAVDFARALSLPQQDLLSLPQRLRVPMLLFTALRLNSKSTVRISSLIHQNLRNR